MAAKEERREAVRQREDALEAKCMQQEVSY